MQNVRNMSLSRGVVLTLTLILLLAAVGGAAAGNNPTPGSGQARWAALRAADGVTPNAVARGDDVYVVSFAKKGSINTACLINDKQRYTPGDALFYDPFAPAPFRPCWFSWFDATNSGLPANADINALHDECSLTDPACALLLSFKASTRVPGVGRVMPQDVVVAEWVEGTQDTYGWWQMAIDGSDVGLTQNSEMIDGLYWFDPGEQPAHLGCWLLVLVSTAGNYSVPDQWGGVIEGGGEDVLAFCLYTFGEDTTGYWFLYHDGSAEGAPANSIIGLTHQDGNKAYSRFEFLTKGPFNVDTAAGSTNDVFNYFGQTGEYGGPTINLTDALGAAKVDSFTVHHTEP